MASFYPCLTKYINLTDNQINHLLKTKTSPRSACEGIWSFKHRRPGTGKKIEWDGLDMAALTAIDILLKEGFTPKKVKELIQPLRELRVKYDQ